MSTPKSFTGTTLLEEGVMLACLESTLCTPWGVFEHTRFGLSIYYNFRILSERKISKSRGLEISILWASPSGNPGRLHARVAAFVDEFGPIRSGVSQSTTINSSYHGQWDPLLTKSNNHKSVELLDGYQRMRSMAAGVSKP